jgi:hypothetical protein
MQQKFIQAPEDETEPAADCSGAGFGHQFEIEVSHRSGP